MILVTLYELLLAEDRGCHPGPWFLPFCPSPFPPSQVLSATFLFKGEDNKSDLCYGHSMLCMTDTCMDCIYICYQEKKNPVAQPYFSIK